ncbi:hypothetical protein F4823DRAFT_628864 [Ustulina deusta]|nr:hypothetical protein F4823DRAFT_628864 [Ustulina deusta]
MASRFFDLVLNGPPPASSASVPSTSTPSTLTRLPAELLSAIISNLCNRDIKNLRLTNTFFCDTAQLRLSRVFLSANPLNVATYRKGITEIIWDEALLSESGHEHLRWGLGPEWVLRWFRKPCEEGLKMYTSGGSYEIETPERAARVRQARAHLAIEESWLHYQHLKRQEEDAIARGLDVEAFRYGLSRFPSLKRVTIIPAAHGRWLYMPLYETPMIRALPYGFSYLIPRGWPCAEGADNPPIPCPWEEHFLQNKWRGFRIVARELVRQKKHISEFVVDAHTLSTGLNCRVFDEPCEEYNNLVAIIQQPGFTRLQLDFTIGKQEHYGWHSFRSGLLRRALSKGVDLEDFRFGTNAEEGTGEGLMENHIPLLSIFPTDKWPRLKHFGLTRFLVTQADMISLLASLPLTIRSVQLSFLYFLDGGGTWKTLLEEMRDTLGWRDRAEDARPAVSIGVDFITSEHRGRAIWADKEVHDFLYNDGETPFGWKGRNLNSVPDGKGIVRDAFDPQYERPHLSFRDYSPNSPPREKLVGLF